MLFCNNSHHKGKILDPIFRQFKVALNSNYIFFLNFAKSYLLFYLFTIFEIEVLQAKT